MKLAEESWIERKERRSPFVEMPPTDSSRGTLIMTTEDESRWARQHIKFSPRVSEFNVALTVGPESTAFVGTGLVVRDIDVGSNQLTIFKPQTTAFVNRGVAVDFNVGEFSVR